MAWWPFSFWWSNEVIDQLLYKDLTIFSECPCFLTYVEASLKGKTLSFADHLTPIYLD